MAIINQVLVAVAVAAAPSSLEPRVTDCPEGSGVDSGRMRAQRGCKGGKSEKVKINLITSTRRIGRYPTRNATAGGVRATPP